jgi:hypothetical protein
MKLIIAATVLGEAQALSGKVQPDPMFIGLEKDPGIRFPVKPQEEKFRLAAAIPKVCEHRD